MKTGFYKKIVIKSKNDLPEKKGKYFSNRGGFLTVMEYKSGKSEMSWLKEVRWYLLPVDQDQSVQVMPTDEEIKDYCKVFKPKSSQIQIRVAINWFKSQLKTVDQEQIEEPGLFFIDENGPTKEYTTKCDGEPEPGEIITDKGIYFDNES